VLLQVNNITKTYCESIVALQNVSCSFDEGFVGVIGPNAAGKTTLLKLMAGVEEPTAGKISYAGLELTRNKRLLHSVMGYLPQDFGFYNSLSGEAMLEYIALLKGFGDKHTRRYFVDEVLDMVNLDHIRKATVGEYSYGMKKRLGVAQALLGKPRLLFLDEPMEGLDPEEIMRLGGLIASLANERLVVAATHSLCDINGCKTIIVLRHGEMLYQGIPEKLAGLAEGLVWRVEAGHQQLEQIKTMYRVVGVEQKEDNIVVRVLAKNKPFGCKAIAAKARLEEGYLALLGAKAE
jgi:ABC-2 type transport system ATP-binding protein